MAQALAYSLPLTISHQILDQYDGLYKDAYHSRLRNKLGLLYTHEEQDYQLIDCLFQTMAQTGADFTNTFRLLGQISIDCDAKIVRCESVHMKILTQTSSLPEYGSIESKNELWKTWITCYAQRLLRDAQNKDVESYNREHAALMNKHNPRFVLRNYLLDKAIRLAENGSYAFLENLYQVIRRPFDDHVDDLEIYAFDLKAPDGQNVSVSCSS